MPRITLPDGSIKEFPAPLSGRDLALAIGPGLARKAIGIKIDGGPTRDLSTRLEQDCAVRILTANDEDADALWLLRHSCAHVLAEAVCALWPQTRLAYGPPVDDGFYYDLALIDAEGKAVALSDAEFPRIEAKMLEIIKADKPFTRCDVSRDEGLARTAADKYKLDNAQRALAKGSSGLSFYATGTPGRDWEDLCAGPHVPSTGFLKACKIMSVAGAYWHGDQTSDQLTRIYGTCFASDAGLKAHLQRIEEAKRRDHRRLGREMSLFHIEEDNPGQVFWHPKGWSIYVGLMDYMRAKLRTRGYVEVHTPSVMAKSLWERSGHWDKYRDNMFVTESEKREFAIKPMNCPGHITIFKQGLKSYRDLPLRMAEFGACCRNEVSGALHGIMRVRGFVQDDAHIFCAESQVRGEVLDFCRLLKEVYADFGFHDILVRLALRPDKRLGDDATWTRAEAALGEACREAGLAYVEAPGEGAFYGPKLEFTLTDAIGRKWQLGTIQLDYLLPSKERLDATYVGEDGQKHNCVMLHRAVLGSLERFVGILLEHFEGKLPLWLAPEQIRILPISDSQIAYARSVAAELNAAGLRASVDENPDKLGAKIRLARNDRVPYFGVVGEQEVAAGSVALQDQKGEKLGALAGNALRQRLLDEVASRGKPA